MGRLTFQEEGHIYYHDGVVIPNVTRILEAQGLAKHYATEWHLQFGRAVHLATEYFDWGTLDWSTLDPRIKPRLEAYQRFKEKYGFKPRLIEHRAHSHIHYFCCTLDREGELEGFDSALVEIKTGAWQEWWGYQLAGQDVCLGLLEKGLRGRYALELRADGDFRLWPFRARNDRTIMLAAVTLYNNEQRRIAS